MFLALVLNESESGFCGRVLNFLISIKTSLSNQEVKYLIKILGLEELGGSTEDLRDRNSVCSVICDQILLNFFILRKVCFNCFGRFEINFLPL